MVLKEMQYREYLQSKISLNEGRCMGHSSPMELGIQSGAQ